MGIKSFKPRSTEDACLHGVPLSRSCNDCQAAMPDVYGKARERRSRVVEDSGASAEFRCVHGVRLHTACPWCPQRGLTLRFAVVEWEGELWVVLSTDGSSLQLMRGERIAWTPRMTHAEVAELLSQDNRGEFTFTGYVPKPEE